MIGFVLLLVFALLAFLMYLGKIPALLALPVLAFLLTFIAGVPFYFNQYPAEMSFILKFGKSIFGINLHLNFVLYLLLLLYPP